MLRTANRNSQASIPAPKGWTKEESLGNPGIIIFTPGDLKEGEEFNYTVYPVQVWLEKVVKADPLVANKHTKVNTKRLNKNAAVAVVMRKSNGASIIYLYFANTFDQESGLLRRARANNPEIVTRYEKETGNINEAAMKNATNITDVPANAANNASDSAFNGWKKEEKLGVTVFAQKSQRG
jgi:hypothetical protein